LEKFVRISVVSAICDGLSPISPLLFSTSTVHYMRIKTAFIFGIIIFLLFVLFRGSIQDDVAQLVFVSAFIVLEGYVIYSIVRVYRRLNKNKH
jgi:FtsH-binding integral membrane protein